MLIIDGYNILFCLTSGARKDMNVERERDRLVKHLAKFLEGRKNVVIVFDGGIYRDALPIGDSQRRGGMKIVFTKEESADDRIVRMVEQERDRKGITVVTSDRAIVRAVEKLGASTTAAESFVNQMRLDGAAKEFRSGDRRVKEEGIDEAAAEGWMEVFGLKDQKANGKSHP